MANRLPVPKHKYVPAVLRRWEPHALWVLRREQQDDDSNVEADQSDSSPSEDHFHADTPTPTAAIIRSETTSRKLAIRRTGLYFTLYSIKHQGSLPRPQDVLTGDVATWRGSTYVREMNQRQDPTWAKVKDGHAHPDKKLPDHELAIRAGMDPAWVKGGSKSKSKLRNMRKTT